ncbi:alpha/beta fold hydrolase [Spirillospora sp. NBC_01491]|uniref:alpha/beta fold hydrolase n=1 Tax=Spirillospora sp. NBC_01491 TaxID=2976007 RepID=UPI002E2F54E4|nr:alpha/beta hydrolase [Spirillospora sp. NBC_01491]
MDLDLDAKAHLLARQDMSMLPAEPAPGLHSIVMSDGPIGVRETEWSPAAPSFETERMTVIRLRRPARMKLNVHQLGNGDRTAILVHGVMSSARTWVRVAPLLAARGYRVLMPDLRGHGASPHAASYTAEDFAGDLVESLPAGADVAIGHSLGALSLSLTVAELRPAKAVYSDPAWTIGDTAPLCDFGRRTKTMTREDIAAMNPRWALEDIGAEKADFSDWDVRVIDALPELGPRAPEHPIVPSLVQAADPSFVVSPGLAATLRHRGFEVRVVPRTGHCIHRDDLDAFMASLHGWI